MKHTLLTVLATTALALSAPAFAASNINDHDNSSAGVQLHNSTNGSAATTDRNGATRGSATEMNEKNCPPESQEHASLQGKEHGAGLKKQQALCEQGEHSGSLNKKGSSSGSASDIHRSGKSGLTKDSDDYKNKDKH